MSVPMQLHRFVTLTNLDCERINDNLEQSAGDVNDNLDNRYTYSVLHFNLDGVTNASTAVLRELAIRRPGTNNGVEVWAVEFYIYAAGSETWTLTCSDTTWPSITTVAAGATTKSTPGSSLTAVSIPSSSADVTFTASCPNASTITAGQIVVHLRCDRGNQGASHAGYAPTLIDSASSTAGSLLDTQLTNLASAVSRDTANATDLRCMLFQVRNLAAGSALTINVPGGVVTRLLMRGYVVSAATETVTFDINSGSGSFAVVGTGVTTRATGSLMISAAMNNTPMTPGDDDLFRITDAGAATALLAYVMVWWA